MIDQLCNAIDRDVLRVTYYALWGVTVITLCGVVVGIYLTN